MSHHKPDPNKSVNLTIDGLPVTVPEGTTILEAARKINVKIPTLCDHPDLCRRAVCRICVVECDGRGKLMAACANDVSEGTSIVTNSARIVGIRKTILELILANHPPECLSCTRNMNCELQTLAADFGIRSSPFRRNAVEAESRRLPVPANETVVRDMRKCVKCGRCVEICQEVQTVRAINTSHRSKDYEICTPYGQALGNSPCIFCGQCAAVCPVGAIFERDETEEVWTALNDKEQSVVVQIPPSVAPVLCGELGLPPGTVTSGKIISALKQMGFYMVLDAGNFAEMTVAKESKELSDRIKTAGKLPLISCCSPGWVRFIEAFYPDLKDHLPACENPEQNFKAAVKEEFTHSSFTGRSKITFVSVMPCIAKKYSTRLPYADNVRDKGIVLSPRELAGMIRQAGVDISCLPESSFSKAYTGKAGPTGIEAFLWKIYEAYSPQAVVSPEAEVDIQGTRVKALIVNGLADARKIMDSIQRGECDAAFVGIMSCPSGCTEKINRVQ